MKPSWSRLNSRITPIMGAPFGPGGRDARILFVCLVGRSSVLFTLMCYCDNFNAEDRRGFRKGRKRVSSAFLCEYLCDLCVKNPLSSNSFQEIDVDSRFTIRNHNRANCFLVELNRPGAADDSVNVSQFAQAPQRRDQQSLPDTAAAFAFRNPGRAEEATARAFVSGETNHATFARRHENRHRLMSKAHRDLVSPGDRKVFLDEFAHRRELERLSSANVDALRAEFMNQRLERRHLQQIDEQVGHCDSSLAKNFARGETELFLHQDLKRRRQ